MSGTVFGVKLDEGLSTCWANRCPWQILRILCPISNEELSINAEIEPMQAVMSWMRTVEKELTKSGDGANTLPPSAFLEDSEINKYHGDDCASLGTNDFLSAHKFDPWQRMLKHDNGFIIPDFGYYHWINFRPFLCKHVSAASPF